MRDIYNRLTDSSYVLDEMSEIQDEIEKEQSKSDEEYDREKVFKLLYRQFVTGLKINTGIKIF